MVMIGRVVDLRRKRRKAWIGLGRVAARTEVVAFRFELSAVRVVAVAAAHAARVHQALQERSVLVDLGVDLTIRVVQALVERGGQEAVEKRPAVGDLGANLRAPRVARRAALDLASGVLEIDEQSAAPRGRREIAPGRACAFDVRGARPVTRLAADVDRRPGRLVRVGRGVVALLHAGRVAVRAHRVPALVAPAPVKRVSRRERLSGVEREPTTLFGVPRRGEALKPAARDLDEHLLQRRDTEGVRRRELSANAVRALCAHDVLPVDEREARIGAGEVPEHRVCICDLHRAVVVGSGPGRFLRLVALAAGRVGDEARWIRPLRRRRFGRTG